MGIDPILWNCAGSRSYELKKNLDKTTETELICHPPLARAHIYRHDSVRSILYHNVFCQKFRISRGYGKKKRGGKRLRQKFPTAPTAKRNTCDRNNILWAFIFGSRNEHIWALSQLSLCTYNSAVYTTTISWFLGIFSKGPEGTGTMPITWWIVCCQKNEGPHPK